MLLSVAICRLIKMHIDTQLMTFEPSMAGLDLENESKLMSRSDHVGTEKRNAPGGDESSYVNKNGS